MKRHDAPVGFLLVAMCAVALLLSGCSGSPDATSSGRKQTYTVRGQIVQLPGENSVDQMMLIRHEAITDFTDASGSVVGMMSMTMPFPVGKGVSIEGLKAGDPIQFTFTMDWHAAKGTNPYEVTQIKKLPDGTELDFGVTMMPSVKKMDKMEMPQEGEQGDQPPGQ